MTALAPYLADVKRRDSSQDTSIPFNKVSPPLAMDTFNCMKLTPSPDRFARRLHHITASTRPLLAKPERPNVVRSKGPCSRSWNLTQVNGKTINGGRVRGEQVRSGSTWGNSPFPPPSPTPHTHRNWTGRMMCSCIINRVRPVLEKRQVNGWTALILPESERRRWVKAARGRWEEEVKEMENDGNEENEEYEKKEQWEEEEEIEAKDERGGGGGIDTGV